MIKLVLVFYLAPIMLLHFFKKYLFLILLASAPTLFLKADFLLIPMDYKQTDHLKAYGIAYWSIAQGTEVDWLLNYRGGSFMLPYGQSFENEMRIRDVSYERISDSQSQRILMEVTSESANMDAMKLEKTPKIAVYSPKNKQPWDDAVTLALTYAEIPYDIVYDNDVMDGKLKEYDWLHLHHEDFSGQYGKFYAAYHTQKWYQDQVAENEEIAAKYGFKKVSQLKLAVVLVMREFVSNGGFLFAMCSATDTYDIALAAMNTDICDYMFDGDPADPDAQSKLEFEHSFAFTDFNLIMNPFYYEYSDIDVTNTRQVPRELDYFSLFEFSAKWDPVPTMLCQNHTQTIKGFMGQTTAFDMKLLKPEVLVMGMLKAYGEARYIHGNFGKGMWTFYGGHDPEDYQHHVGEEPTMLELHKNSPGYRLILNNILFPAAKKKKQKT